MHKKSCLIVVLSLIGPSFIPVLAQDLTKEQWQDQERWIQFTEKEHNNAGKGSRHTAPKSEQPLVVPSVQTPNNGSFSVDGYIVDPNPAVFTPPTTRIETTIMPAPLWGPSFLRPNLNYSGPYGSSFFNGYWAPTATGISPYGFKRTRVWQSGPSKASGNYYSPSTADPTASGNYYAPTGPRVWPIIRNQPESAPNYWGPEGNPYPQ